MGLRPNKSDEGAAGGWRGINDLRRVFSRAALKTYKFTDGLRKVGHVTPLSRRAIRCAMLQAKWPTSPPIYAMTQRSQSAP
jgi:hypothetical protein